MARPAMLRALISRAAVRVGIEGGVVEEEVKKEAKVEGTVPRIKAVATRKGMRVEKNGSTSMIRYHTLPN